MTIVRPNTEQIAVMRDRKKNQYTFATFVEVEGRLVSVYVRQYAGYQKPFHLDHTIEPPKDVTDMFAELFYWSRAAYADPARKHHMLAWMNETGFHNVNKTMYEVQWNEVKIVQPHNLSIKLTDKKSQYSYAIPPNGSDSDRHDCITHDGMYHCDCREGEFVGIDITVKGK